MEMNKKQIDSKIKEITKLTEAKRTQKETESLQIRKSRNDTHSKIKNLERDLKDAEISGEVDTYIAAAGNLSAAKAFLKILDQREADLNKPTEEELAIVEEFKKNIYSIRGALVADTTEKMKAISKQILQIFEENDNALDSVKNAINEYSRAAGTEGLSNIIIAPAKNTTLLMNFYRDALRFSEAQKDDDFCRMLGIPEEKE